MKIKQNKLKLDIKLNKTKMIKTYKQKNIKLVYSLSCTNLNV